MQYLHLLLHRSLTSVIQIYHHWSKKEGSIQKYYRHANPNSVSHNTMRVWIWVRMSVLCFKILNVYVLMVHSILSLQTYEQYLPRASIKIFESQSVVSDMRKCKIMKMHSKYRIILANRKLCYENSYLAEHPNQNFRTCDQIHAQISTKVKQSIDCILFATLWSKGEFF